MFKITNNLSPDPNHIGTPFLILQQVDSTNNYATALLHEGMADHGTVVFTYDQFKGKGQRDKQWFSTKNQNITISIIIKPDSVRLPGMFLLSMCIAVASMRFFKKYSSNTCIKWPNDIFLSDRKAGGILIENIFHGSNWKYSVAGIGLNINQTEFPALNANSLALETGISIDILDAAKELVAIVDFTYKQLLLNPEKIKNEYLDNLYRRGEIVKLKKQNRVFEARIIGVTDAGSLHVFHGVDEEFNVGDIEWVL